MAQQPRLFGFHSQDPGGIVDGAATAVLEMHVASLHGQQTMAQEKSIAGQGAGGTYGQMVQGVRSKRDKLVGTQQGGIQVAHSSNFAFALRLYALAHSNAAELELLQRQWPTCPRWPLYQRRLELGLERDLRPKLRTTHHSLEHCLQGLRGALHPRLQLVWALLLLNSHGERAIAELIRLLANPNQEVAEVSAWALAQLCLCLRVWDTPWRIRALEFISQQGRCQPLMAARLQPFLEDADSQVRRAAVAAFVSLDGPLDMLEPLLRDPDDEVSGDVAERFLERNCFGPILANLERKGVLSKVHSSFLLLQLLHESGPKAITPYLAALSELVAGQDPELQELALKTLDQVDLDKVRWENWAQFNDCQRDTAVRLMQLHQRFPAELEEQILRGQVSDPLALQHFAEFAPEAALPFLKSGLQQFPKGLRGGLFGAIHPLGQPGWRLLLELLNEPQELALDVVGELTRWMNSAVSWDWLIEQGPALLDGIQSEAVKNALCAAVGRALLGPTRQVEQRKLSWALELAVHDGSAITALLYLQRAESTIPEDLLDRAWLRALEHPQPEMRMQTLAILRRIRKPCSALLRQRPPDAEPEVRLRVLGLLHDEGGLEPREREELVALTRDGSLRTEAQSLLDRVTQDLKG